jgi:hypothetical protein
MDTQETYGLHFGRSLDPQEANKIFFPMALVTCQNLFKSLGIIEIGQRYVPVLHCRLWAFVAFYHHQVY